jgi:hypothetical protein
LVKWEKVDKDLYRAMVTENSTALYERMRITTISSQEAITQVNTLLTSAAQICSGNKAIYQAKPKLKVWNAEIIWVWYLQVVILVMFPFKGHADRVVIIAIDLDYRFLCYYLLLWNIMYEIIDF